MMRDTAKTVFITRELSAGSLFRTQLEADGYVVTGRSLVAFRPELFPALPAAEWIFFYSKKAVRFFFEGLRAAGLALPADTRLAALGPGTGAVLRAERGVVDFQGSGDPADTARDFLKVAVGQRVLFPRAAHSRRSVQEALQDNIKAIDLVVYQNEPVRGLARIRAAILVFTSPLNAEAYFAEHRLRPGQKTVAIGRTTASALQQLQVPVDALAEEPSEEGLAAAVQTLCS